ncbi:MAG: hypothetical protein HDT44_01190 [Ruminococcaceae bacterium]|nr:hypothetical protein [Oscillospiraceae bacterium]
MNNKAVLLEQIKTVKDYIDKKDANNIKSVEFALNTLNFYTSEDKSGEPIAQLALPEEKFLDVTKTELVEDFLWSNEKYPGSENPDLDGKAVLVLAVNMGSEGSFSFISLDSVISKLDGEDTDSANVDIAENAIKIDVKISKTPDNRIVVKSDGLYIGEVNNAPKWTVSTDEEVREMFSFNGAALPTHTLEDIKVGDTVKIYEDGTLVNFIIVHKGSPSSSYVNCDGVWLLREDGYTQGAWGTFRSYPNYEDSEIYEWVNTTYLNLIDEKVKAFIKNVRIPYSKHFSSGGKSYSVCSGSSGLSCQAFLLSAYEVGFTKNISSYIPAEGSKLDYFSNASSRICYNNGSSVIWWTRSPYAVSNGSYTPCAWSVYSDGTNFEPQTTNKYWVRPAFILPYDVSVDSNGIITV